MIDLKQLVLEASNGGLEIILSCYPQAQSYLENRRNQFKIRDERTPSCTLSQYDGIWFVHDFGSGEHQSPIDCYMKVHNVSFSDALHSLAEIYNIDCTLKKEINKPIIVEKSYDGPKTDWLTWEEKPTTLEELNVFIPFLQFRRLEKEEEDKLFEKYREIFYKYGWRSLESYTKTFGGKQTTYIQNSNYPMFIRHCGGWEKIYLPYEYNKAGRFFSHGTKPRDFINGLRELEEEYEQRAEEWKMCREAELAEKGKKADVDITAFRLPAAFICSGERDAMCIAMMGKYPLWLNSETATLSESQLHYILTMVDKVYNIPDIDETGIREGTKMALAHLDIYTINLPHSLLTRKDHRGRSRKDLRDYLELYPSMSDFNKLISTAETAKYFIMKQNKPKIFYSGLLHFLNLNGFFKWEDPISHKVYIVRVRENKRVKKVEPYEVDDFMYEELQRRGNSLEVKEAYLLAKKTFAQLLDSLPMAELDFKHYSPTSRVFDFMNCSVRVTKDGITVLKPEEIEHYTWEDKIIPFNFEPYEPSFSIDDAGHITIRATGSKLQYFVFNSSRIYWRAELEDRITHDEAADEAYATTYHYSIEGSRLSAEEIATQREYYFNKMYFIGNILHRHKSKSHGFAYWLLENNLIQDEVSSGGSGKSFIIESFRKLGLINVNNLDGRDKKLLDNPFMLERIDSETDLVNIDDIAKETNFYSFYNKITGDMIINRKGLKSFELKFEESPNFTFTSNFAQPSDDPSTMRRIINVPFSDYYHHKTVNNSYAETRTIRDDMDGRDLFAEDYTTTEYNNDINFYLDCLVFYLYKRSQDEICRPPMENIYKRIALQNMGQQFYDFCEMYFIAQNNANHLLVRQEVYDEYKRFCGFSSKIKNPTNFRKALEQYCNFKQFVFCPKDLECYCQSNDRLIKMCTYLNVRKSYEMLYIQTEGAELNNALFARYLQ